MPFVFDNIDEGGAALTGGGKAARKLAERISDAWVAFATNGNPSTVKLPKWEPYDTNKRATMLFSNQSRLAYDPRGEEREIIEEILFDQMS